METWTIMKYHEREASCGASFWHQDYLLQKCNDQQGPLGKKGVETKNAAGFPTSCFTSNLGRTFRELAAGPQLGTLRMVLFGHSQITVWAKCEKSFHVWELLPRARGFTDNCSCRLASLRWLTLTHRDTQGTSAAQCVRCPDIRTLGFSEMQAPKSLVLRRRNHERVDLFSQSFPRGNDMSIFIKIFKGICGALEVRVPCYIFSLQLLSVWMIPEIVNLQWVLECIRSLQSNFSVYSPVVKHG